MKKLLILPFVFLSLASIAQVSFGVKGGFITSTSKTNMPYSLDISPRHGFTGGVFANFKIIKHVSFQPELIYSMRGCSYITEYKIGSLYYSSAADYKYNYLDLPLLLNLSVGDKFSPFINIGVSPSYLLSSSATFKNDNRSSEIKDLNKLNLGLVVSPGIKIKLNKAISALFEIRYQYGSIDLYSNSNKEHTSSLAFYTGFIF